MERKKYLFIIPVILGVLTVIFFWDIIAKNSYFWFDFIIGNYPRTAYMAETLSSGNLPLWIPFIYGGQPFAGTNPSHFLYPFNAVLSLFTGGGHLSSYTVEISIIIQIFLGGLFMFLLLQEMKMEKLSSLFGALIFTLSLPVVVRTQHTSELYGMIWIPLIFYFLIRTFRDRSYLFASISGLICGICILGAHPQFYFYLVPVLGAYLLYRVVTGNNKKTLILLSSLFIITAFLISSPRIMPEIQYTMRSARMEGDTEGYAPLKTAATIVLPHIFGKGMAPYDYWGGYKSYLMFVEYSSYIGIISLVFICILLFRFSKQRIRFFIYLLGFALIFMYGKYNPIHKLLTSILPGLRFHVRFMPFFVFSASILSSFSLDKISGEAGENKNRSLRKLSLGFLIGSVVCLFITLIWKVSYRIPGGFEGYRLNTIFNSFAILFTFLSLSFLTLFLYTSGKIKSVWFRGAVIAILFTDLYLMGSYFPGQKTSPDKYYSSNRLLDFLKYKRQQEIFRVDSPRFGYLYANSRALMHRIESLDGHVANKPERFIEMYRAFRDKKLKYHKLYNVKYEIRDTVIRGTQTLYIKEREDYLPRAWFVLHKKEIPDKDVISYMLSDSFDPGYEVILNKAKNNPEPGKGSAEGSSVSVRDYSPQRIELSVSSPEDGYLVLSEHNYPGWIARDNGKPVEIIQANYLMKAVFLGKGNHSVVLKFSPRNFYLGIIFATAGIIVIIISGILQRKLKIDKN